MTASNKHLVTLLGLFLTVAAGNAFAYTGRQFEAESKISIKQAREIALKAHPGKVTDEELEQENGGSGLRYSFDIKHGKVTQEVGVDAKTGNVLENAPEGANAD